MYIIIYPDLCTRIYHDRATSLMTEIMYMASWCYYTFFAIIILIEISSCSSEGSGKENTSTLHIDPTSSLVSMTATPTKAGEDSNSGLDSEVVTAIIIGILLIILFLLVCIILVACCIIKSRNNKTRLMEVSKLLASYRIVGKFGELTLFKHLAKESLAI